MTAGGVDRDASRDRGLRLAAQALNCDRITAEVVRAMNAADIPTVLLKGPSIARWLYPAGGRTYSDTDLLVPFQDFPRAEVVLRSLGFKGLDGVNPLERLLTAIEETTFVRRDATGVSPVAKVDLHHNLPSLPTSGASLWEAFWAESETIVVAGVEVRTSSYRARAPYRHPRRSARVPGSHR